MKESRRSRRMKYEAKVKKMEEEYKMKMQIDSRGWLVQAYKNEQHPVSMWARIKSLLSWI